MNHPSEEDVILIYLNDDGSDGLVAKHVAACEACNAASEEMSKLTKTLKSPVVWSLAGQEIDVPADLEELAETLAIEERESTTIFSNLRENAGDLVPLFPRTAGGIRYALQLCHDLLLQAPVDALRIADAAATVALELSLKHYPEEVVWYLRAEAEKERANALSLMGELSEALIAAQNSGRYIGKLSVGDFEHAVLGYVRAAILI